MTSDLRKLLDMTIRENRKANLNTDVTAVLMEKEMCSSFEVWADMAEDWAQDGHAEKLRKAVKALGPNIDARMLSKEYAVVKELKQTLATLLRGTKGMPHHIEGGKAMTISAFVDDLLADHTHPAAALDTALEWLETLDVCSRCGAVLTPPKDGEDESHIEEGRCRDCRFKHDEEVHNGEEE